MARYPTWPSGRTSSLNAGVHALRARRAVHVGRVPGKEHPAGSVARSGPVVEAEPRGPHRLVQADPAARVGITERPQFSHGHRWAIDLRARRIPFST